ncbi:MAG: MazG family protein [Chloroflexota bacterium]|nr:MazG family protein [Chloroflexota bacterium]
MSDNTTNAITILGLGPGDPGLLTREAWQALLQADEVHLRTEQHPAVAGFPGHLVVHSFDHLYVANDDFNAVYQAIAAEVVALGRRPQGVVYAVPGDPSVGETTTQLIRWQAESADLPVRIISGMSFLEPVCRALEIDSLDRDGLQLLDAMVVATSHAPPFDPSRPALLAQCYSRPLASDVKLTLLHSFDPRHVVFVVQAAGTADEKLWEMPLFQLDRRPNFDHLTSVYLPPAGPCASYGRLQEIVARLRAPDGCPWDREQTLQSLRQDLLEETYELLEALDRDDDGELLEELGDTTLMIAMLAQIASEEERFRWPEVMTHINEKLIRRHPHVFGDEKVAGTEDVLATWARIKSEERSAANGGKASSPLESVPTALPALSLASKYQSRLARAGMDLTLPDGEPIAVELWQIVVRGREVGIDAETVLREFCQAVAGGVDASML